MSFLKDLKRGTRDETPEEEPQDEQIEDVPGTLDRIEKLEEAMTKLEVAVRSKEAELVTLRGLVNECPRCSRLVKGISKGRPTGKPKPKQKVHVEPDTPGDDPGMSKDGPQENGKEVASSREKDSPEGSAKTNDKPANEVQLKKDGSAQAREDPEAQSKE